MTSDSMPRVVLASFDRVPSAKGASQHILANAAALMPDHHVSLVSLGDTPTAKVHRHLPLHIEERNWLRRALAFQQRMHDIFARTPFDIYHVRSPWEGLAVPAGKPLIYEVNGLASIELPYHHAALHTRPTLVDRLRLHEDALIGRADLLVTPSAVTRAYLIDRGADPARVHLVPNRPTLEISTPPARADGPTRLVYIGTLTAWQGLWDLIKILPRLSDPVELTVATAARKLQRKALQRFARKAGVALTIIDAVPPEALGPLLQAHDIAVAPLTPCARNLVQGCMPIKLLDYMAAGLPILVPDMPVVRDVLGPEYPLYRRYSRSQMRLTLQRLIDDAQMRSDLVAIGHQRVTQFDPTVQRDALRAVYRRLTSANSAS